ncbi:uncharacterized protein LOC122669165 [Telopea speciosissima]|uniref:uncharacterized protein LOC122669165 n=1 Tax=Telopea speciosissima TaxID=54955 RepID=UPI001CC68DBB|nr:uncharacterized protein LOC122669165 [Telopea speciosissima]
MARGKLILICQSGGEFVSNNDGSLQYTGGGEAHAVDVHHSTSFDDLKLELAEMWNFDIKTMSMKYFLPSNKRTLITVSNDKDLKRMIDFHGNSVTADVFISGKERVSHDVLNMHASRGNRVMVSESINHIAASTPAAATLVDATPVITTAVMNATNSPPTDARATLAVASAATSVTVAAPSLNAPTIAAPVIVTPTDARVTTATSVPATTTAASNPVPDCTTDRSLDVATDATIPSSTGITSIPTIPAAGATFNNVQPQKHTASWTFGTKGLTIVAVADKVGQERNIASQENDTRNPASVDAVDDERQRHTEASISVINNPTNDVVADDAWLKRIIASWKKGIKGEGQQFKSVHEFRDVLRKYSLAHHFAYKMKKNDTDRATAICRAEGCSWRIHASWMPSSGSFMIKKMNKSHTCEGIVGKFSQSTKNWLSSVIKDRLRDTPYYKPRVIANDICREFGIELHYSQVWRGMESARVELQGSSKEAYNQLPQFCEKLVETNPGSFASVNTKDDLSFQRLFVSFYASHYGFQNGCRPLIFLDSTSLKSKYREILLAATAVDGNDGAFPVAFAVVDVENDDNWHWFLEQLKPVVLTSRTITFVSDKDKGLRKSVHEVFENAHHGYCIHYLIEKFKKNLKGPYHGDGRCSLAGNLLAAAHASRLDGFRMYTQKIKSVSSEAYNWVMQSEPEYWANSQLKGERYNQIKLDMVELLNNWIKEVRELSIIQKIDTISCKMMELISTRRVESSNWHTKLTPSKEERLQEEKIKAHGLKVLFSSDSMFEVHDDCIHVVNLDQCDCSCQGWKIIGLPCCHAVAVFNCTARSPYDYCSRYFMTEAFVLTYSESINPMPDIGKTVSRESSDAGQVHPPHIHRPPTQPNKRKRTKSQETVKRSLHCSKCKGEGHNRATCKETY